MLALATPYLIEPRSPLFVFCDPLSGEVTAADIGEHLPQSGVRLLGNHFRSSGIVPIFRSVAHRIAHEVESAAIHEVDDQFEFVHAFEICDLRLIPGFYQRFKPCFYQRADAAAEDGLFSKQVGFGFFGKGRFNDTRTRAADALGV